MSDYNSLDDLLKEEVNFVTEYDGFYYVKLKPKYFYENSIWKVNKKTGEVSYMMFTEYIINVVRLATPVDLDTLKRVS